MSQIRKADPAARRQTTAIVVIGAVLGCVLILAFDRWLPILQDWLLSETGGPGQRVKLTFMLIATLVSAPLLIFAAYLWSLGAKVFRVGVFPPPGHRVLRDTPVLSGKKARFRGRTLQVLAVSLALASILLWPLFWRLTETLGAPAA